MSRANILLSLKNAYITTGRSIKKRPCLTLIAVLEAGTVGLKASGGKLLTFYGQGVAITHANSLFQATRVPAPLLNTETPGPITGEAPIKIPYCDQFNALPYVVAGFSDGSYTHYYLDDPGAWKASTAYTSPGGGVQTYVRPTAVNGFRYRLAISGTSGSTEPAWPTALGTNVIDGSAVWECDTFSVTDPNCPQSKIVTKRKEKIYAANGPNVSYCKTGDPRDWTTASDAGFLPAGLQATGSDQVTGLGDFQSSLVIFFSDSSQVWAVASDPSTNALTGIVENVGTIFSRAARALAGDLFFLSQSGFRSISLLALTANLQDQDVGNAIDKLVVPAFSTTDDPLSIYYPKLGQWLCINGSTVWVYSFSRTAKLSAWAEFNFPFAIDDATVLNQELYFRSGDSVYKVDSTAFSDNGSIPLVDVQMFYQDANRPDVLKQFMGFKSIGTGSPTVSFLYAADNQTLESEAYELPAISESGSINPVELCATRIAPHFQHQKNEDFELSMASLLYENLGPV